MLVLTNVLDLKIYADKLFHNGCKTPSHLNQCHFAYQCISDERSTVGFVWTLKIIGITTLYILFHALNIQEMINLNAAIQLWNQEKITKNHFYATFLDYQQMDIIIFPH